MGKKTSSAKICGYEFSNEKLLKEALTHPSLSGKKNYQRLEFLGDRVLGLVIADWLLETFPKEAEGKLNRRFTQLVRKETLAELCIEMGIQKRIEMADSAESDGTRGKSAVLSDVCEAVIGAIYEDGGLKPARKLIHENWASRIDAGDMVLKDAKTRLQEWAQARRLGLPVYEAVERSGPDHSPVFTIRVDLEGKGRAKGKGNSKRIAEQLAAEKLLAKLKKDAK